MFHWISPGEAAVCCRRPSSGSTPISSIGSSINEVSEEVPTGPTDVSNHPNLSLLPSTICGPILGDKVAYGEKTALFEYPWMALVKYRHSDGFSFRCGGSLITDRYVLTAAHSIARLRSGIEVYSVILAEYDVRYDEDYQTVGDETICSPPTQEILSTIRLYSSLESHRLSEKRI
uniref:Uncharacterized protein n=1 Tax=Phlebotomus papatasi TaxID=29031 RepID=A0A1B0DDN5_PHLPP